MINIREASLSDPKLANSILNEDGAVIIRNFCPIDMCKKVQDHYSKISERISKQFPTGSLDWKKAVEHALFVDVPELQMIPHRQEIKDFYKHFFNDEIFIHPHVITRLVPPVSFANKQYEMLPHQDFPYNQGTPNTVTTWLSFFDCDMNGSALSVSLKTHKSEMYLYHEMADLQKFPMESSSFKAGDVILFHSKLIHCTFPNNSEVARLSIDFRVQPFSEPVCKNCLSLKYTDSNESVIWDLSEVHPQIPDPDIRFHWLRRVPKEVEFDSAHEDSIHLRLIEDFTSGGKTTKGQIEKISIRAKNMRVVLRAKKALAANT